MMVLDEKSGDHQVITIHPEVDMNICTTFHANLSNSCQSISPKSKNVNLMVAIQEMSEDCQSNRYFSDVVMSPHEKHRCD